MDLWYILSFRWGIVWVMGASCRWLVILHQVYWFVINLERDLSVMEKEFCNISHRTDDAVFITETTAIV